MGICARECGTKRARAQNSIRRRENAALLKNGNLVTWRVVSGPCVNIERRQSSRSAQLDLDFAPTSIVGFVAWPVSKDILVSQLHANF